MIFVPFIFFLVYCLLVYKKNGFDISVFILLSYILTSFCAIILYHQDFEYLYGNYSTFDVSIVPTIVYCSMIGMCITPYVFYNSNKKRKLVRLQNKNLFNKIATIYFVVFIGLLILFAKDLVFRFLFGNLGELREMAYEGELLNAQDRLSGPLRAISTIFTLLGDGASFMIVFFFYSICALENSNIKNISILLSSLSPVIIGLVSIDRSKTTFWIFLFGLCFMLFKNYIPDRKKSFFIKLALCILGLLLLYLLSVTISRFGDMDDGTGGGLLSYIGQPFLNFCEIWNKVSGQKIHTERILPLTNFLLGNDTSGIGNDIRDMYYKTGVHLNVFFSFVGMFLVDLGHWGAIVMPLIILFITRNFVNRVSSQQFCSLDSFIIIFGFAAIVECGTITYFYTTMARTFSLIFFIFISRKLK